VAWIPRNAAVHAHFAGGHAGISGLVGRAVTKAAIESDVADMMFMTEWHRLFDGRADGWRDGESPQHDQSSESRDRTDDGETENEIEMSSEDLAHRRTFLGAAASAIFSNRNVSDHHGILQR
jgi:hypothetical protein